MTKYTFNSTAPSPPRWTKKRQLIRMLSTKTGAEIAVISSRLGWQSHTTRAAITGLRKAAYSVVGAKADPGKPTRYRIVATPGADAATEPPGATDAG